MNFDQRQYQIDIIDGIRAHMKSGVKSIAVVSATGSGKTVLSALMVKAAHSKNFRTWFLNHRIELVNQVAKTFSDAGIPYGICAAGFAEDRERNVQICSIQTLSRRVHKYAPPKLIIWDEAAHLPSQSWDRIYKLFPDAFHVLLTATPIRLDGKGLKDYAQVMVQGPSVRWLIDNNYLSNYRLYAPSDVNLNGVHVRMGDYLSSDLQAVMDKPTIIGRAIDHYRKYADGKRALVFAVSIQASKHIAETFKANGIPAAHIDGDTPRDERLVLMDLFAKGDIKVISNVSLFGEGLDIQALECVIQLRPTMSLGLFLQMCGRSLRIFPGKAEAIIIDAVGNCFRHGLIDEERQWTLEGRPVGSRKEGGLGVSVRICPSCFAAQPGGAPTCKYCGTQFPVTPRKVQEVEGELEEIRREAARKVVRREQGMAQSMQELYELGKARGLKNPRGWAYYVFKSRQIKRNRGIVA